MSAIHSPAPIAARGTRDRAAELSSCWTNVSQCPLERTAPFLFPDALAYVAPHAGPIYSGAVAAAVYRSLQLQRPDRIVLLAFPHRGGLQGVATPDVDGIATPLGEVPLDSHFAGFPRRPERVLCDHSFEIQLPFLQKAAPHARLTALYVGTMSAKQRREAGAKLAEQWRPGTVFLASSDFTHYGRSFGFQPFPADGMVAGKIRSKLDLSCITAAGSLDSDLFLDAVAEHEATICGAEPIALLLDVLQNLRGDEIYQHTLDYQASGEITRGTITIRYGATALALGYFLAHRVRSRASDPCCCGNHRRCGLNVPWCRWPLARSAVRSLALKSRAERCNIDIVCALLPWCLQAVISKCRTAGIPAVSGSQNIRSGILSTAKSASGNCSDSRRSRCHSVNLWRGPCPRFRSQAAVGSAWRRLSLRWQQYRLWPISGRYPHSRRYGGHIRRSLSFNGNGNAGMSGEMAARTALRRNLIRPKFNVTTQGE